MTQLLGISIMLIANTAFFVPGVALRDAARAAARSCYTPGDRSRSPGGPPCPPDASPACSPR